MPESSVPPADAATLLGVGDPPPFEAVRATSDVPLVIVCDHASNRIPTALGDLGLTEEQRRQHIAWDIGAAEVAYRLAHRYGAGLLLGNYSRLVIDLNRHPPDAAAMRADSDGVAVPGNADLSFDARQARVSEIHRPYHTRIAEYLDDLLVHGVRPLFLAVHSMTDQLSDGHHRPQQIAFCWAEDARWMRAASKVLEANGDIVVGDNVPYAIDFTDYTVPEHAMRRGLPHLQVEFRQDLIATPADAATWADRFVPALDAVLGDAALMAEGKRY